MKKNFLLAALLCVATLSAQDDEVHFAEESDVEVFNHEAKIGVSLFSSQLSIDVSYEYLCTENFTFGIYASKGLDPFNAESVYFTEKFSVMPFVRYYLGFDMDSTADGTYVEGFARFISGKEKLYDFDLGDYYAENANRTLAGAGIGKKYLFDSFSLDALAGLGLVLNPSEADDLDTVFLRVSVIFGYRF